MCLGQNLGYSPILGNGCQSKNGDLYTQYDGIPMMGWMTIASIVCFEHGTYIYIYICVCIVHMVFSRMRSKGSRLTLGVWGLTVCSLDVAQPFPTVRNRPREGRMAVPMVSSAKWVTFGGFKRHIASFRAKSRFVWQAHYFRDVFRRCVPVFVAGSALATSIVISHGRRSTLDVLRCVFSRIALSRLREVVPICSSRWPTCTSSSRTWAMEDWQTSTSSDRPPRSAVLSQTAPRTQQLRALCSRTPPWRRTIRRPRPPPLWTRANLRPPLRTRARLTPPWHLLKHRF